MSGSVVSLLQYYKYPIIFPLATFEGPVVSLAVGFLVRVGVFKFLLAYLVMITGDIIPDSLFYFIGYYGNEAKVAKKYLSKSKFFSNHFPAVERLWLEHPVKIMFFGKLAYGMALPFLITAGMTKIPYKRFIKIAFPITLLQYFVLMVVGYYLGSLYGGATKYVEWFYFVFALVVVVFMLVYLVKFARRNIAKIEKEAELGK